jgi:hypothetical protein
MADQKLIKQINQVIEEYFKENNTLDIIPVKKLMPAFIKAGIFKKDTKNGQPIRKILRELDESKELNLIPFVHTQRNENAIFWYFIPSNVEAPTTPYKQQEKSPESIKKISDRLNNDENYVIDLCDIVLERKANRQKRFGFLLGDWHKDGKTRTSLPVDAYYGDLKLVVEFKEYQNTDVNSKFNKSNKQTVSGVNRQEQRKLYDERRAEVLPEHGIEMIILSYSNFSCDSNKKIIRNETNDLKVIKDVLMKFINE